MQYTTALLSSILIVGILSGCNTTLDNYISNTNDSITTADDTIITGIHTIVDDTYHIDDGDFVDGEALIADTPPSSGLTDAEIEGIILMREEEKLARDVYAALGDMRSQEIFTNIASSEQTHMNAMGTLIDRYNLADPIITDVRGVFSSPTLQSLYDELITQGSTSLLDALIVGATIEDLDIYDLENLMSQTTNPDILTIYNNLTRGSRNHLRAFYRQITQQGEDYQPQYISMDEFTAIVSSDQEKGNHNDGQGGSGNGRQGR